MRNQSGIDHFNNIIKETIKPLIYDLINEIQDAIAYMYVEPVLEAFGILDPRNLPDDIEDFHEYGKSD